MADNILVLSASLKLGRTTTHKPERVLFFPYSHVILYSHCNSSYYFPCYFQCYSPCHSPCHSPLNQRTYFIVGAVQLPRTSSENTSLFVTAAVWLVVFTRYHSHGGSRQINEAYSILHLRALQPSYVTTDRRQFCGLHDSGFMLSKEKRSRRNI